MCIRDRGKHHQAQNDAGQHVASVIDQGVDPGAGHGLAEERVGHPLAPHKDADEEMRQKDVYKRQVWACCWPEAS